MPDATIDPVPPSAYPTFAPVTTAAPVMPAAWSATVLLHPFSPPPGGVPLPDNPFFEMSVATIDFAVGQYFSARVAGCTHGWWYVVTPTETRLSLDQGVTWNPVAIGWSLPANWYGAAAATAKCAGASPMNWMVPRRLDWWRLQVPQPGTAPPGATWLWFDSATGEPVRMMFGMAPPSPTMGDPTQLAFFQMFSLTYFASFTALGTAPPLPTTWVQTDIPGVAVGNPKAYKPFVWNDNFALTSFSTPVNGNFNPLATRTLYVYKPDADYKTYTDRAQSTLMHYTYNPDQPPGAKAVDTVTSLLTGVGPTPAPHSGAGFLSTVYRDGSVGCVTGPDFSFGQEPPWWVSIPAVKGTIEATITDNPALSPGHVVTVYSVLFPPAPGYPDGTYLWTWYSPDEGSDGARSRPICFMQSDSGVGVGTSLALADYFYYANLTTPIDPGNFVIPPCCLTAPQPPEASAP